MTKKLEHDEPSRAGQLQAGQKLGARPPVANIPPFGLRMQPELKARVEMAAAENNRSLNAEIVSLIEYALEDRKHMIDSHNRYLEITKGGGSNELTIVEVLRDDMARIERMLKTVIEDMGPGGALAHRSTEPAPANSPVGLGQKPDERLKDQPGLSRSKKPQD